MCCLCVNDISYHTVHFQSHNYRKSEGTKLFYFNAPKKGTYKQNSIVRF